MTNQDLIGWRQTVPGRTMPAQMRCNADEGDGRTCEGERFKVMHLRDGGHVVCERCETEYTLGEVLNSANER